MAIPGSCLCGALRYEVRYEVRGPLNDLYHCHCSRCRKAHGAPFASFAITALSDLHWLEGQDSVSPGTLPSGSARPFCKHCGSPAPGTLPEMGLAFVFLGSMEGDPGIRPMAHIFVGSKAPWFEISDAIVQHAEGPPSFAPPR